MGIDLGKSRSKSSVCTNSMYCWNNRSDGQESKDCFWEMRKGVTGIMSFVRGRQKRRVWFRMSLKWWVGQLSFDKGSNHTVSQVLVIWQNGQMWNEKILQILHDPECLQVFIPLENTEEWTKQLLWDRFHSAAHTGLNFCPPASTSEVPTQC